MDDERPTRTISTVVPAAEHELLAPGTEVGEYEIDDEIGHGGMGVVYRATHPVIGKQAAIKVLRREMAQNRDTVDRFIQEARSVNAIGHPNIIDVFAFGNLPDGRPYLMMDLLLGESLRGRLKRGPLHVSEAASVLDEVASALAAAHDKGVIHRDLKPDNVFLVARQGRWPEVKLLDFGLAKLIPSVARGTPIRTHTGIMLGTPDYMAPEQVRERSIADPRCDVYAFGVMAFESLTGRRPFPAAEGYDAMLAVTRTPAPELASIAGHVPRDLAYLVDGMLLKDPGQRPSLADVRASLKRLRAVLPTQSVASLEMQLPARPVQGVSLGGLTASRVGAEPLVPAAAAMPMSMPFEPTTVPAGRMPSGAAAAQAVPTPRAKALQSAAVASAASAAPASAGTPPPVVAPPGPISQPQRTMPGTVPPQRRTPAHLPGMVAPMSLSEDELSELPTNTSRALPASEDELETTLPHDKASSPVRAAVAARLQAHAHPSTVPPAASAGVSSIRHGSTRLGVEAPRSASHPAVRLSSPLVAPAKRGNNLWLVLGALLAIGAGIALAVALAS